MKWTVFHIDDDSRFNAIIRNSITTEPFPMTSLDLLTNYTKVVTYEFNALNQSAPDKMNALLWRLTQNIDSSWLREEYPNITESIELFSESCDSRSSMVGDIFMDRKERVWYVVKPVGFAPIYWVDIPEDSV